MEFMVPGGRRLRRAMSVIVSPWVTVERIVDGVGEGELGVGERGVVVGRV